MRADPQLVTDTTSWARHRQRALFSHSAEHATGQARGRQDQTRKDIEHKAKDQ